MLRNFSEVKFIGIILFALLQAACIAEIALAACYRTPSHAIAATIKSSSSSMVESGGYRVARIRSDPLLGQTWATIIDCAHPGWPAIALPLSNSISPIRLGQPEPVKELSQHVVIRAGDTVQLWRQERLLRIEVEGISEDKGGLGEIVKVRLLRGYTDDKSIVEELSGIVRGPFDVEMEP